MKIPSFLLLLISVAFASLCRAEPQAVAPITVEGKLGPYRALVLLTIEAVDKGDYRHALLYGRIFEAFWDRSEAELKRTDPSTWYEIDSSLDAFINPLGHIRPGKTDVGRIRAKGRKLLREIDAAN